MRISSALKAVMLVLAALVAPVAGAGAQLITYTFTGQGTGTLGTAAFTNAFYSAVLSGQASNAGTTSCSFSLPSNTFINCNLSGSIFLTGLGTNTFALPLYVFDNQAVSTIGFGDDVHFDLLDAQGVPGSSTYGLATNFGPADGTPTSFQFNNVATSGGLLTLDATSNITVQASTGVVATPEPATGVLLATGLMGIFGVTRRRNTSRS